MSDRLSDVRVAPRRFRGRLSTALAVGAAPLLLFVFLARCTYSVAPLAERTAKDASRSEDSLPTDSMQSGNELGGEAAADGEPTNPAEAATDASTEADAALDTLDECTPGPGPGFCTSLCTTPRFCSDFDDGG